MFKTKDYYNELQDSIRANQELRLEIERLKKKIRRPIYKLEEDLSEKHSLIYGELMSYIHGKNVNGYTELQKCSTIKLVGTVHEKMVCFYDSEEEYYTIAKFNNERQPYWRTRVETRLTTVNIEKQEFIQTCKKIVKGFKGFEEKQQFLKEEEQRRELDDQDKGYSIWIDTVDNLGHKDSQHVNYESIGEKVKIDLWECYNETGEERFITKKEFKGLVGYDKPPVVY